MAHLGDRVAAYVDGQLPVDEAARADAHLAACDECFEAVLAQRALKRRMTGLCTPPSPSSTFLSALSDPARLAAAAPPSRLHLIFDHVVVRVGIAATGASAVLAGIAYAVGAPATPADTVAPPVEQFVAQFRGEADPIQQSVGAVGGSPSDVALVVAPGHAVVPTRSDSTEAVSLLEEALGSSVSVRLLANRYDLSVIRSRPGRSEVIAADDGRRVAAYVIEDADGRLRQVVRYAQQEIADPVFRAVRPVPRTEGIPVHEASAPLQETGRVAADDLATEHGVQIDTATIDRLAMTGWPCHDRLGRSLERVGARWVDLSGDKGIALTYTDGRSTVTVYEQNGALDRDAVSGFARHDVGDAEVWVREGTPTVATWDYDGIVFTVVTDAPASRLRDVIADLPQQPHRNGMLDRVRTGLERLTAWTTPGSRDA
ncbi:zf-HC2 domain-containing protein [Mumia sp. zg.B17]|uniref:zf-HC2 domain-containing protein n=1 Tax=Mumia sp. zg.B17 TaxID=2855446 RepID=UPI001C6EE29A|nr:zf-HC2 domain-containing protein [Mumia sp. zg.B17]MBW9206782.1 zf-HC2 domain-containing protein [Mumia sp. zg.B17]